MRSLNIEYIYDRIYHLLTGGYLGAFWQWIVEQPGGLSGFLRALGIFLSLFAFTGIIYSIIRLNHVRKREQERFTEIERAFTEEGVSTKNERWQRVSDLSESQNPGDW